MSIWKIYGILAIIGAGLTAPSLATPPSTEFGGAPFRSEDDVPKDLLEFQARERAISHAAHETADNLIKQGYHSAVKIASLAQHPFVSASEPVSQGLKDATSGRETEAQQARAVAVHRSAVHVQQR